MIKKILKNSGASQGQILVEFMLALPILLLMVTAGYEFGNLTYIQNRLNAAAYEGTKIVPQVTGSYVPDCTKIANKSNCLSETMITRARRVLENSGLKNEDIEVNFVHDFKEEKDKGLTHELVGISIKYPYVFFWGQAVGITVKNMAAKSLIHYKTIEKPV